MVCAPSKYPASAENTTLMDKPTLVISLKSVITEALKIEDFVAPKPIIFCAFLSEGKDTLKKGFEQRNTKFLGTLENKVSRRKYTRY